MATYQSPEQWKEWSAWLSCALQSRSRWRLPVILMGILFATGRRTVSTWLRAAGVSPDYREYYYFLQAVGRKARPIAERLFVLVLRHIPLGERVLLALDDSPTKRYGPHVEGAGIHHNPTPGPADQKFLYGHRVHQGLSSGRDTGLRPWLDLRERKAWGRRRETPA